MSDLFCKRVNKILSSKIASLNFFKNGFLQGWFLVDLMKFFWRVIFRSPSLLQVLLRGILLHKILQKTKSNPKNILAFLISFWNIFSWYWKFFFFSETDGVILKGVWILRNKNSLKTRFTILRIRVNRADVMY